MKKPFLFFISLIVLVIAGGATYWYVFFGEHGDMNRQLFDKYFKPYPNVWTREQTEKFDSADLKFDAMRYYDSKNYKLALEAFHEFEPQLSEDGYYNLYLGISGLESGFTNIAIINLITSAESFHDFNDIYTAKWYLSLAYLRADRTKECIQLLEEIIKMKAGYSNSARLLLNDLSR